MLEFQTILSRSSDRMRNILWGNFKPGFKTKPSEELKWEPLSHRTLLRPFPIPQVHVKSKKSRSSIALYVYKIIRSTASENILKLPEPLEKFMRHSCYLFPNLPVQNPDANPLYYIRPILFSYSGLKGDLTAEPIFLSSSKQLVSIRSAALSICPISSAGNTLSGIFAYLSDPISLSSL